MEDKLFKERVVQHIQHVINVGKHCDTEETTKQALILPLLDILGFSPYDPTKVKAEYQADFVGVKNGERVDYALFCHGVPVMFIEAKSYSEDLNNHSPQLSRYFNATPEVAVSAITNGREWRFFTDLKEKNIMDNTPFLKIKLDSIDSVKIDQLMQFCHDAFQPEALRTLAEESVYLSAFTKTISESLKNVDLDFVRFVASKSNIGRQLNQKFLETIAPIVKNAVEKAVSDMVLSGLSIASNLHFSKEEEITEENEENIIDEKADIIDPNNEKIVTTYTERLLFDLIKKIVGDEIDIVSKDTESYFSILYQGKTNRWLVRYFDNKQRPSIQLPIEMTDNIIKEVCRAGLEISGSYIIIDYPENVLRISGLIKDSLLYCQNDENFSRKKQ
ncbi:type I restriction endonuclease [Gallibacterium salpingitidis]|uniref:Type I restriction enzyme R protein n=1 Tax=Gallibacterium salpingitidis TaxID=505341 RepID=A0A1A7NRX5_9PAST|nr:type I restriction endonuclease [Gallibacterium salpingitidis]OBW92977.1 type I restriction enzyme R protein [Gallibacterium salpingitidis]